MESKNSVTNKQRRLSLHSTTTFVQQVPMINVTANVKFGYLPEPRQAWSLPFRGPETLALSPRRLQPLQPAGRGT